MAQRKQQEEEAYEAIWGKPKPKPVFKRPVPGSEEHEKLLVRQGYTSSEAYRARVFHKDRKRGLDKLPRE